MSDAQAESSAGSAASGHLSPNQKAWQRFKRNRPAVISAWFLIGMLAVVVAWPATLSVAGRLGPKGIAFAEKYDPRTLNDIAFDAPSAKHWFGTDDHGRDLFSRLLYGAQISLSVGAVGALVSLVIGVLWGAMSGYLGGRWDEAMMRVVDVLYSLPSIILVIVLITMLEGRIKQVMDHFNSPELTKATRLLLLFVGLGAVNLVKPGVGVALQKGATGGLTQTSTSLSAILEHTFPTSIIDAMARGDVLQIVVFTFLFGMACAVIGAKAKPVVAFCESLPRSCSSTRTM